MVLDLKGIKSNFEAVFFRDEDNDAFYFVYDKFKKNFMNKLKNLDKSTNNLREESYFDLTTLL